MGVYGPLIIPDKLSREVEYSTGSSIKATGCRAAVPQASFGSPVRTSTTQ